MKKIILLTLFLCLTSYPVFAGGGEKKPAEGEAPAEPDVVMTIMEDEHLTQLSALLEASGLNAMLHEKGPFTIFAPHDDAFDAISETRMEKLLNEENKDELIKLMKYHIMPGPMLSRHMVHGQTAVAMMNEDLVLIKHDSDGITIDGHSILTPDITTTNGWIHVIDHVLDPGVN